MIPFRNWRVANADVPPQNILLWQKDYFWENIDTGETLKTGKLPFVRETYIYKGNLHLDECLPNQKRRTTLNHKKLINGEDIDLYRRNKPTFVYRAFPGNFHNWHPRTHLYFIFNWRWYLRWWLGPSPGVTQFPWISPRNQERVLGVFHILI